MDLNTFDIRIIPTLKIGGIYNYRSI